MRTLIVRAGALGDVLLLRPALHALGRAGHSLTLVAPEAPAALLAGEIEAVVPWEGRAVAELLASGTTAPPELVNHDLALAFTRSADLVSALRRFMPVRARDPLPPPGVHAAHWATEAVADLALNNLLPPPITPALRALASAEPILARLGRGFLALHPGSGSPRKSWPGDRFRALADSLSLAEHFLVVEGPADRDAASVFDNHPRAVFARGLELSVLGALLSHARLWIGNDSGVAHLAAAFGAPCLVLFGPTDPEQWAPIGNSVHTLRAPTLASLDLEQVLAKARSLAARSRGLGLPSG